jgi:glycosyltransferase involved in cell wall biosynthesis
MKLGIVLNYIRHDSTYAALKTAEMLRDHGYYVTFFDKSYKSAKAKLHAYWDDFILSSKEVPFEDWLDDCDIIVWFTYPTSKEMKFIRKEKIPNVCVATWDSVDEEVVSAIKACDKIVSPSKAQATYFSEYWRLKNVAYVPLSCNVPLTHNNRVIQDTVKMLVACPGYQIKRIDHSKLFDTLYEAMKNFPNLNIDFLFSSKVANQIKINVNKFEKTFDAGNKLTCIDDPTGWSEGPLCYSLCDIVLWPAQLESFGYVGLEALSVGTPVIAYNFLPMSEIIHDQVNGFLIACDKKETDLGVNYAGHANKEMLMVISGLMSDPSRIVKARLGTHKGLVERNKEFIKGWEEVLEEVTKVA